MKGKIVFLALAFASAFVGMVADKFVTADKPCESIASIKKAQNDIDAMKLSVQNLAAFYAAHDADLNTQRTLLRGVAAAESAIHDVVFEQDRACWIIGTDIEYRVMRRCSDGLVQQ